MTYLIYRLNKIHTKWLILTSYLKANTFRWQVGWANSDFSASAARQKTATPHPIHVSRNGRGESTENSYISWQTHLKSKISTSCHLGFSMIFPSHIIPFEHFVSLRQFFFPLNNLPPSVVAWLATPGGFPSPCRCSRWAASQGPGCNFWMPPRRRTSFHPGDRGGPLGDLDRRAWTSWEYAKWGCGWGHDDFDYG